MQVVSEAAGIFTHVESSVGESRQSDTSGGHTPVRCE